ncbi:YhcN/YlaJ family sporulation lipoprotein [Bacillus sp. S/N-304-OC-R1]|nr:YhcN/YlaJ family sporulation lipoprotein [Bacillus sp. S/N-304-OC-R1]
MKKSLVILGICGITALTACQSNKLAGEGDGIYERSGNTLNVNTQRPELYNRDTDNNNGNFMNNRNTDNNTNNNFGYVRHQKSPIMGENVNNSYGVINREQLADMISAYCADINDVDDISTLVTDEEVLVIYSTDSKDRNLTADQVKKTAMSVVPRWYHVYVSDNTSLRRYVENFATNSPNTKSVNNGLNKVIKEMLKSPQGYKMGNGENENGEKIGEKYNNNNRNMK